MEFRQWSLFTKYCSIYEKRDGQYNNIKTYQVNHRPCENSDPSVGVLCSPLWSFSSQCLTQ